MNILFSRFKLFYSASRRLFVRALRRTAAVLTSSTFKKFAPFAILILVIGIALPMHFAHAASCTTGFCTWLTSNVLSPIFNFLGWIIVTIINILLLLLAYIVLLFSYLAGGLLNQVIDPAFSQSALHVMDPNGPVAGAWNLLDGLANIVIIFAVLFMGIGTMLDLPDYNWKTLLPKVVIAAILINFSLAIVGFGIDIAQVVMNAFLVSTSKQTAIDAISGTIFQNLTNTLSWGNLTQGFPQVTGALGNTMTIIAYLIFSGVSIFFYLLFFLYLLARIVALWLLAMVSPLAFAMNVIPSTQQFFNKWKTELINWLLIGPLMAATLFFAAYFLKASNGAGLQNIVSQNSSVYAIQNASSNQDLSSTQQTMNSLELYKIFPELFALLVLYFGYKTSKSWSAAGASFISGQIDRAQKATTNYAQKAGKHYGQQAYSRTKQSAAQGIAGLRTRLYQGSINRAANNPEEQGRRRAALEPRILRQREITKHVGERERAVRATNAAAFQPKFLQRRDKDYEEMLARSSNEFVQNEVCQQKNSRYQYLATREASKRKLYGATTCLNENERTLTGLRNTALALKDNDTATTLMAAHPRLMERVKGGGYNLLTPNEMDEIIKKMGDVPKQLKNDVQRDIFKEQFEDVFNSPSMKTRRTHEMRMLAVRMLNDFDVAFKDLGGKAGDEMKAAIQRMKSDDFVQLSPTKTLQEDHVWPYLVAHGNINQIFNALPNMSDAQKNRFNEILGQAEQQAQQDPQNQQLQVGQNQIIDPQRLQSLRNAYNRRFNINQNPPNPQPPSPPNTPPPPNNPPQSPLLNQHGLPYDPQNPNRQY